MRTRLLVAGALAVSAGIAATPSLTAAAPADCDGRVNDTVELLTECVTLDGVRSHQQAFQDHADANGGIRAASTPGYDASAAYVVEMLEDAGYSPVVDEFDFNFFEELSEGEFEQIAPAPQMYVNGVDFDVMTLSGPGDVTGVAVPVDLALADPASSTSGCEIGDFTGFPAGSIALMQRGGCSFELKAQNAADSGAVGAIIFNQGNTEERKALLLGRFTTPAPGIPTIGTTFDLGVAIQGATVRVKADTIAEVRTTANVLADLPGDPDSVIVVGAHLDSVAEGPGVQDNGSGSAAILEIALQMAEVEPTNTVRFAWWGAEEAGLVGSTDYVNTLSDDELDKIQLNLNFDMIGSPNFVRFVYDGDGDAFGLVGPPGSAAVEAFFEDWYASQGLASEPTAFSGRSDYQAFINNGIPAGGLFTGAEGIKTPEQVATYGGTAGEQYDPCYHLACDTFDNISLDVLDQNSDAVAAAVVTYAMDLNSVNGNQIAFFVGDAADLTKADQQVADVLSDAGYDVLAIDDDELGVAEAFVDFYAEIGIISSSVVPSKLPGWLEDTSLPLLNTEGFVSDDLGMATRSGEQTTNKNSILMNPDHADHPLAAGLSGWVGVTTTPTTKHNFGVVDGDAIVIATTTGRPKRPTYYAYEARTTMANGEMAPARRVSHFPVFGGLENASGAGLQLLLASVEWLFEEPPAPPVQLQILAINDFHGNIATSSSSFGGVGRSDFLAANIAAAEAEAEHSIFVSAGDLIGASPLISALFHDEPTIESMNLMGLDINAVGNHEFDEGPAELLRMANGGSHPVDGDLDGDGFAGADFEFLAANVVDDASGETIFPGTSVRNFGGVDVAFIGMTLEGTPSIVTPSGVAGLTFNDEVDTVNALIPELQADGIEAIVVLLHEGGFSDGGQNDCGTGLTGPIADISAALDPAVDLVVAGHTNDEFVCQIGDIWVTMADNRGRLFTDIDTELDPETGEMTIVAIDNKANLQAGVTPDAAQTALIDKYDALSAPLANAVIGTITADITRTANPAGESALGDVIADAQLASTAPPGFGDAVVAFMNPGGIREDLSFAAGGAEADGEVTFGEAFGVQPFGNSLVTMTLTGAQIDTLLEQQWVGQTSPRILQVSDGFTYTWDSAAADGSRVDIASIEIDGTPISATGEYRVTVNSFLADGGDNFFVLVDGTDRLGGEVDLDALVTYFGANSPVAPGPQNRISMI